MASAELRWPPYPYRAGFTITDDADAAELATVKPVYDLLAKHGIRVTRTVWAFRPEEPCGLPGLPPSIQRGVTLEDPEYARYCAWLGEQGFEIALHGASAGNNRSAATARAFARLDALAPPARTFVCHAKNADNPYWQEKVVARGPLRRLLELYARGHRCGGEDPSSPYFWGDLCRERVRYVRLLRTRRINTLAANPSMPYFEREKPFVRGWFSATKRSFRDATRPEALAALEREWGACFLYQYLCRYTLPDGSLRPEFTAGVAHLAERWALWCAPASELLDRLRLTRGICLASMGNTLWLFNTNDEDVDRVQIETRAGLADAAPAGVHATNGVLCVDRLPAGAVLALPLAEPVAASGSAAVRLDGRGRGILDFGHGRVFVNVSGEAWSVAGREVPPGGFARQFDAPVEGATPRARASDLELTRLFLEQAAILLREFLFKGRGVDSNRWLASAEIALENHDNW